MGGLKPMTRHLERLEGSMGLPKKNQSSHFTACRKVESDGLVGVRCTQTNQSRFVFGTVISIGEEISRTAQQFVSFEQRFMGKSLIRRAITAGL